MPDLAALAGPDALSDLLHLVRLRGRVYCRSEFTAPWSVAFPGQGGHFHFVERGTCWIQLQGVTRALPLSAGDLAVLPHGTPYRLGDTPKARAVPLARVVQQSRGEGVPLLRYGKGGTETSLVCGAFDFDPLGEPPLLAALPPVIVVEGRTRGTPEWLDLALRFLASEVRHPRAGTETVSSRLVELIFVQVVREWIQTQPERTGGWLGALRDPQLARALGLMHGAPERAWTATTLARELGMSRSRFADRFVTCVGEPPMTYLRRWRMLLAERLLAHEPLALHEVAHRVGYESEVAFSRAFKRAFRISPDAYRRQRSRQVGERSRRR